MGEFLTSERFEQMAREYNAKYKRTFTNDSCEWYRSYLYFDNIFSNIDFYKGQNSIKWLIYARRIMLFNASF